MVVVVYGGNALWQHIGLGFMEKKEERNRGSKGIFGL